MHPGSGLIFSKTFKVAPALGLTSAAKKFDEIPDPGIETVESIELRHRAGDRLAMVKQFSARLFKVGDVLGQKPRSKQADAVQPAHLVGPVNLHIGGDIMMDSRGTTDVSVVADRYEVMNTGAAHHVHIISAGHVPRDHDIVGQHAIASELGIVTNMAVDHQQVVAANARATFPGGGSDVDGDAFAKMIVVGNFNRSRLAVIFAILGWSANDDIRMKYIVATNSCSACENNVAQQLAASADGHFFAHAAERADFDVLSDGSLRIDATLGRNLRHIDLFAANYLSRRPSKNVLEKLNRFGVHEHEFDLGFRRELISDESLASNMPSPAFDAHCYRFQE
jgi:hypothetical protein